MYSANMYTIPEAAFNLGISIELVTKFINLGLVTPVKDGKALKLTSYNFRRLLRAVDLYEKSYSPENIEALINH